MQKIVTPYNTTEHKKAQVETMFNNIAPTYDRLNHILSLGVDVYWRNIAIKRLKKFNPQTILDIACGTGDFSFAALKANPETIIGIDISEEMLEIGRKKILAKNLSGKMQFLKGDSENLQFQENSFDAVTVAFGVRNFENLQAGLKEMCRVLKPGSPVVILEFSKPRKFPVKQLFNLYFKTICPLIGRLISKDKAAYKYLSKSVSTFPDGDDFLNELEMAGFKNTKSIRLTFGVCSLYTAEK